MSRKIVKVTVTALAAVLAFSSLPSLAARQTITTNGQFATTLCLTGSARVSVNDGGGGDDSGTVVLEYQNSFGDWYDVDTTSTWSSGDSGAIPLNVYATTRYRFAVTSVAGASADIDAEIVCSNPAL